MSRTETDLDRAVLDRYSRAARSRESALCCPVAYDSRFLEAIPEEILERDYGCGDPSRHLRPGESVLDLGSGGGKICYIAAQVVGATGRVIGVDRNDEMLALARKYQRAVGERLGYENVCFRKGRIEDLSLDLEALEARLREHPVGSVEELDLLERWTAEQRRSRPLVETASVDVVVSNCVLNLVQRERRRALFGEIFRVVRPGGRVVISDIVSDQTVPEELARDPQLWSGCVAGAFREDELLEAFERAGLYGARILERDDLPWRVVDGIEFRSTTVEAFREGDEPSEGCC